MSTLKKNFVYAFGAQGLHFVQSILWSLLVPKILGVEEFGYWQLFIFYTQYGGFISLGLTDGIYLREGGKEYSKLNYALLGYQLKVFCLWQIIALMPFVLLGIENDSSDRMFTIITSCVFVLINNITMFLMYVLQAVNEIKTVAIGRFLITVFFIVFILGLVYYKIDYFQPYIICYFICNIVCGVYYVIKSKEIVRHLFVSSCKEYRSELFYNIKVGIVLLMANVCGMLILGFGRFLVDKEWGIKSFAIVSFAFMFVNFFLTFVTQASLVLFPELKRWNKERINEFYVKKRSFMSLYFPMVLLLYMPIYYLVQFWLPQYMESVKYLLFLMPLCIFDTKMNLFCNTLFKVFNEVKRLLICNIVALACSVVCIIISIYILQSLDAVVVSMLLAIILRSVVAELLLSKLVGVSSAWKDLTTELLLVAFFIVANFCCGIMLSFVFYLILMVIRFLYAFRVNLEKKKTII